MSINHAGFTFGGLQTHQTPVEGEWVQESIKETYFGVVGAQVIPDNVKSREIRLRVDLLGFTDFTALKNGLDLIDSYGGNLYGTLTITLQGYPVVYQNCLFERFERYGGSFVLQGGTLPGVAQEGTLVWTQMRPNQ